MNTEKHVTIIGTMLGFGLALIYSSFVLSNAINLGFLPLPLLAFGCAILLGDMFYAACIMIMGLEVKRS